MSGRDTMEEVERSQLLMPRDLPSVLPEAMGSYTAGLPVGQQHDHICTLEQQYPTFLAPGTGLVEDNFSTDLGDDSSTLRLSCTLFLFLLHQRHLRKSGIRSQRLGTPALKNGGRGLPWRPQWLRMRSQCRGPGSIPGQGTKIPRAAWCSQNNDNKKEWWQGGRRTGAENLLQTSATVRNSLKQQQWVWGRRKSVRNVEGKICKAQRLTGRREEWVSRRRLGWLPGPWWGWMCRWRVSLTRAGGDRGPQRSLLLVLPPC